MVSTCFTGKILHPEMHVDCSIRFGPLVGHVVSRFGLPGFPKVTLLSNVENGQGQKMGADRAGMLWYSVLSFMACQSLGSFLYRVECPPLGGDTEFASTRAAHGALPKPLAQRLAGLHGMHDYRTYLSHRTPLRDAEKEKTPAVRTHPQTGAGTVYLSEGLTSRIAELPDEEGRALVVDVSNFATESQFVYRHARQPNDLVIWDNRSTMHRTTEFENHYRRLMRRTTVTGDKPFYLDPTTVAASVAASG